MEGIFSEILTPVSAARREAFGGPIEEAFRILAPSGWALVLPSGVWGGGDDPYRYKLAFSRNPRPLAPLPAPPLFSHLLIGGEAALVDLVLSAPTLHLAPADPKRISEFLTPPGVRPDIRLLWSVGAQGLIPLASSEDRRRALRAVQDAPSGFALVAGAGPGFSPVVAVPSYKRSILWTIGGISFGDFHTAVTACDWLLRMNASGNACLYSTRDLGPLGLPSLTLDQLPTRFGPRRGPPIPADILGTLATATRVDLSNEDTVTDLRALLQAPMLQELVVDGIAWLDIDTIVELRTLRSLSMRDTWVEDLSFLENLPALKHLVIDVPPVQGWEELSRLFRLRRIDVPPDVPLPKSMIGRRASF